MSLVCNRCNAMENDSSIRLFFKQLHPHDEEHDIPWFCNKCLKNARKNVRALMEEIMLDKEV